MKVFLYRHAHAVDGVPDADRELSNKGLKQIKKLAKHIPSPELEELAELWHSPLVRAEQTMTHFKEQHRACADVPLYSVYELAPDASVEEMAKLLAACEGDVVACGHNPFLEELLTSLVVGEPGLGMLKLKKGGMVCLERTTETSDYIPFGLWIIKWYWSPVFL